MQNAKINNKIMNGLSKLQIVTNNDTDTTITYNKIIYCNMVSNGIIK